MATAIRADIGEAEAYKAAGRIGEVGIERPQGANIKDRADFVTARRQVDGEYEIILTDVKTRSVETSRFPKPNPNIPQKWHDQLRDALARLKLDDAELEEAIHRAYNAGRVRRRQVNVDYAPSGGGSISGL